MIDDTQMINLYRTLVEEPHAYANPVIARALIGEWQPVIDATAAAHVETIRSELAADGRPGEPAHFNLFRRLMGARLVALAQTPRLPGEEAAP